MRTILLSFLSVALLGSACATTGAQRLRPEPAPGWASPEGRLEGRLAMAETMLLAGEPRRAVTALSLARGEPESLGARDRYRLDLVQARAYHGLGMYSEALALLEPWQGARRKDSELHRVAGLLHFELGELEAAERSLSLAAALAPADAEISNNLGFLLLVSGRPEEAVPRLREAVALVPSQPRYRNNLGFALAADGRSQEALQVFRAAAPEPLALAWLGLAHERARERELALARFHEALQIDPTQAVALAGLARLRARQLHQEQP